MANKDPNQLSTKTITQLQDINTKIGNYLDNTLSTALGSDQTNKREIDGMSKQLDIVLNKEYKGMTRFSDGDFTKFINLALKDDGRDGFQGTNINKLINDDANAFSTFFYERYKNVNNKYEDLRMVVDQLAELGTAVSTLRDAVVASDGAVCSVSKTFEITGQTPETEKKLRDALADIDEKYKLDMKMHDTIVPNTLTFGDFYVLHQPYARIFSKFEISKGSQPFFMRESALLPVVESANGKPTNTSSDIDLSMDVKVIYEALESENKQLYDRHDSNKPVFSKQSVEAELRNKYANIEVINDGDAPYMEDSGIASLSDPTLLEMIAKQKRRDSKSKRPEYYATDGVNTTDVDTETKVLSKYADIPGVYTKLLSPLRLVPVHILDECVGYYVLYESYGEIRNSMLQNNQLNKTNLVFQNTHNRDTATSIVDVIATRIIRKIDNKFVQKNLKFRDLIVNALMYDDLYKKDFKVQFIAAEYITHFRVNEDVETHLGVSMLKKSLFYAKLYMTMLMFKVISAVTRSNDTRVFYVRNSGIDKNIVNQVQRAARDYKDNQISYNDVASVNTLMSKAGKAKDLFIGTGRTNERAMEFDVIAGQDVNMNTDFIEFLRKGMINGSDVPAVILEYNDAADFAKSIEMGNIKYANKIFSTQRELNTPSTEMYRAYLRFEHPEFSQEEIESVFYKFNKPRALGVQNDADTYNNTEQGATFITKVICGDNSDEFDDKAKDAVFRDVVTNVLLPGMFDWEAMRKRAFEIQVSRKKDEAKLALSKSDTDDGE